MVAPFLLVHTRLSHHVTHLPALIPLIPSLPCTLFPLSRGVSFLASICVGFDILLSVFSKCGAGLAYLPSVLTYSHYIT